MRLENRVSFITGGAQGIGSSCVKKFLEEGAFVTFVDTDVAKGEELVRELEERHVEKKGVEKVKNGGNRGFLGEEAGAICDCKTVDIGTRVRFIRCDVKSTSDIEAAMAKTEEIFGGIDILVNNAAIQNTKSIMETSEEEWDDVINTNLSSVFRGIKAVVPRMRKRGGGAIVNISSSFAIVGSPGYAAYHASKGGVSSLTRAAALDLLKENIRVNAVCPGTTETPGLIRGVESSCGDKDPQSLMKSYLEKQPLDRFGKAQEIANVICFLASGEASFVIGANVVVDGGYTIV